MNVEVYEFISTRMLNHLMWVDALEYGGHKAPNEKRSMYVTIGTIKHREYNHTRCYRRYCKLNRYISLELHQDDFGGLDNNGVVDALLLNHLLALCNRLVETLTSPSKTGLNIRMRNFKTLNRHLPFPEQSSRERRRADILKGDREARSLASGVGGEVGFVIE